LHVHLLRTQATKVGPPKKLLRSLAGLGGVSDSTLAKQLAWIREHPEVLCATCITQCSDEAMKRSGDNRLHLRYPSLSAYPFLFRLANQVLENVDRRRMGEAALSDITIGSERVELADGTTDDFVSITLPDAISDLCRKSPNFLRALRDMAEKCGPRLHAYACTRTLN
jgi:hypothetical protein